MHYGGKSGRSMLPAPHLPSAPPVDDRKCELLRPQKGQVFSRDVHPTLAQQCLQVCLPIVPRCHASKHLNTLCPCERERERENVFADKGRVCEREKECVCVCMCVRERKSVCMCVCVRGRKRVCVCVCARVCERVRESVC